MSISLPVLTIAALTNGLNPCGIGMTITFLGYLLVFGGKNKDKFGLLKIGLIYILSVFVTYLFTGLMFYGLAYYMQRWWITRVIKYIIGGLIILAGMVQIKDVFWRELPFHLVMPKKGYDKLSILMEKTGVMATIAVGILTTVFSTPCMMPLYMGTAAVLARSGLPMVMVLLYFLYYNLIFILPLIVILTVMVGGKQVVEMKEWEHKNTKWMRFSLGIAMIIVGILIVK